MNEEEKDMDSAYVEYPWKTLGKSTLITPELRDDFFRLMTKMNKMEAEKYMQELL